MQQKMRKTLVILALLGTALLNYPRPGRGGTASGAYSQAAKNAQGGRDTYYSEPEGVYQDPEYIRKSNKSKAEDKARENRPQSEKDAEACAFFGLNANCAADQPSLKRFWREWSRTNHPDKGGNDANFARGSVYYDELKRTDVHPHAANNTAEDVRQRDRANESVPPTNSTPPA